jgi:hypothetical protein
VFVTQHQSSIVHHQIGFKTAGQAEVDVAQPPRALPVVALARPRNRQRGPVDEGSIEGRPSPAPSGVLRIGKVLQNGVTDKSGSSAP